MLRKALDTYKDARPAELTKSRKKLRKKAKK